MTEPQIITQFSLLPVVRSAVACGVVGGAAAVLWQFPMVREVATSAGFKKVLMDGVIKLSTGAGGSSAIPTP